MHGMAAQNQNPGIMQGNNAADYFNFDGGAGQVQTTPATSTTMDSSAAPGQLPGQASMPSQMHHQM